MKGFFGTALLADRWLVLGSSGKPDPLTKH
jgi:hypothetical protein